MTVKICFFDVQEEIDIPFEEEILRNPYTLKSWFRYIEHKAGQPIQQRIFVHEQQVQDLNPARYEKGHLKVNNCFERALVLLHKL
ncbi:13141_t:CDS:2 [Cetraspora pellucida]|uniref:13141_t:CDS:1 n=1 Tax=Cetraspora pellucida TaxID=1433469 RepID=A0A9N8ZU94_9GLOM|nr:13141_t:CDS:2 [Cetraspora pellucida]